MILGRRLIRWGATALFAVSILPILNLNVERLAETKGWDMLLSERWGAIMSKLSQLASNLFFLVFFGLVLGATIVMWSDYIVRRFLSSGRPTSLDDLSFFLDDKQFERVTGHVFQNERVPFDGRWFDHCQFISCTIQFDGNKDFKYSNCTIVAPFIITSDSPNINRLIQFLYDSGATTFPLVDEGGRPVKRSSRHVTMSEEGNLLDVLPGGRIDYTQDFFKGMKFRMEDFYTGRHEPHRDKVFRECTIVGPAMVIFTGKIDIDETNDMHHNDWVEIKKAAKLSNVIRFHNITMRHSRFDGITILVQEGNAHMLPNDTNWITRTKDQSSGNQSP